MNLIDYNNIILGNNGLVKNADKISVLTFQAGKMQEKFILKKNQFLIIISGSVKIDNKVMNQNTIVKSDTGTVKLYPLTNTVAIFIQKTSEVKNGEPTRIKRTYKTSSHTKTE